MQASRGTEDGTGEGWIRCAKSRLGERERGRAGKKPKERTCEGQLKKKPAADEGMDVLEHDEDLVLEAEWTSEGAAVEVASSRSRSRDDRLEDKVAGVTSSFRAGCSDRVRAGEEDMARRAGGRRESEQGNLAFSRRL